MTIPWDSEAHLLADGGCAALMETVRTLEDAARVWTELPANEQATAILLAAVMFPSPKGRNVGSLVGMEIAWLAEQLPPN